MSVRRFAGYFFALVACATAAFSSLPTAPQPSTLPDQTASAFQYHRAMPMSVQVALAR